VVIRSSSAREVGSLVAELRQGKAVRREAAIARLRVLGGRAVAQLTTLVRHEASAAARAAGLRALEGIEDPRVADIAIHALRDRDTHVRLAAVMVLRSGLLREHGTGILDALAGVAVDETEDRGVRSAARDALAQLPADIVRPILEQTDEQASGAAITDDPRSVHDWLTAHTDAPLSRLHDLLSRLRERETHEPEARRRGGWLAARGAVHALLARRGSRIALYDLREAFDAASGPLPVDFLAAAAAVGDATCLEPLGRAWAGAGAEPVWRDQLSRTASDIVTRLALTARHAAVRRATQTWPGFLRTGRRVNRPSRTRPPSSPARRT
jgi:hypothetical protein